MDNVKFAKLCRETGVVDRRRVTPTDVDLTFTKVKPKGQRKITFMEFLLALQQLSAKRYPKLGAEDAYLKLRALVLEKGAPKESGTSKAETGGIYDKLTDASLYTGAHKERFDRGGRGRGLAGRDSVGKGKGYVRGAGGGAVHDLSQITRPHLSTGATDRRAAGAGARSPRTGGRSPRSGRMGGLGGASPGSSVPRRAAPGSPRTGGAGAGAGLRSPAAARARETREYAGSSSAAGGSYAARASPAGASAGGRGAGGSSVTSAELAKVRAEALAKARAEALAKARAEALAKARAEDARGAGGARPGEMTPGKIREQQEQVRSVFHSYARFGAGATARGATIDGAKFAKLCKETGVVGGRCTATDVDLAFTKAKRKGERRLTFEQFYTRALPELAGKRFQGMDPAEASREVLGLVAAAADEGPKTSGASKAETGGIYAKLTDARLYTGAHKERFDRGGRGRGLAGRDSVGKGGGYVRGAGGGAVHDLSQITRPHLG